MLALFSRSLIMRERENEEMPFLNKKEESNHSNYKTMYVRDAENKWTTCQGPLQWHILWLCVFFTKSARTIENLLCGKGAPSPIGRISHTETCTAWKGQTGNSYTIPTWEKATSTFRGSSHCIPPRSAHGRCLSNDKCSISLAIFIFISIFGKIGSEEMKDLLWKNQRCCPTSWCLVG